MRGMVAEYEHHSTVSSTAQLCSARFAKSFDISAKLFPGDLAGRWQMRLRVQEHPVAGMMTETHIMASSRTPTMLRQMTPN